MQQGQEREPEREREREPEREGEREMEQHEETVAVMLVIGRHELRLQPQEAFRFVCSDRWHR